MDHDTTTMGRNVELTERQVLETMKSGNRPVWTATQMAEETSVTRATATKRLKNLAEGRKVETVQVGNATAYYLVGIETKPSGDHSVIKHSLRREFEDKFIGLPTAPWEVGTEKPVEPGDRVQLQVEGSPGNWGVILTRHYDSRRKELHYRETSDRETQALISGEVYEKPTVPIEHTNYPDDYDLEEKIGGPDGVEWVGDPPHQGLFATGFKNYLIRPANDAKFIRDIEIEWVNPESEGQELETFGVKTKPGEGALDPNDADDIPDDFDPEESFPPTYADIVQLSEECTPKRAYLEERDDGDGYDVIPADMAGDELTDYRPTERFEREVRDKRAVDGPLHFRGENDE